MKLSGKVAIVSGAGSGIGRATAHRLAAEGASVVCADVVKADVTAGEIAAEGGKAAPVSLDVRDAQAWAAAVVETKSLFGPVDFLANIAGVVTDNASGFDTALEQTDDEWDRIMAINLRGTWYGIRATLPTMMDRGSGSIVNIASMAALIGMRGLFAYTASKGAVAAMTRQLSLEYVEHGITINAIAPGFIRTPIQDGIAEDLLKEMTAGIPMRRYGMPADIAGTIAHLFSNDGNYVTGQIIAVDGGWGAV